MKDPSNNVAENHLVYELTEIDSRNELQKWRREQARYSCLIWCVILPKDVIKTTRQSQHL